MPDASTAEAVQLQPTTCATGANHQLVQFPAVGGTPYYRVVFVHSGECADVSGYRRADHAVTWQATCHFNGNQQWRVEYLGASGLDTIALLGRRSQRQMLRRTGRQHRRCHASPAVHLTPYPTR